MTEASKENFEPLISIIVPVYKVEKYIDRCVKSIINQTYKNIEIILVDDGSPDNCPKICDEFEKIDKRIKVIHKKNGGLSDARNTGIDAAKGEYIGFVDSDDMISIDMYRFLLENIEKYNADISVCEMKKFKEETELGLEKIKKEKIEILNQEEYLLKYFKIGTQTIEYYACNKLYKRDVLESGQFPVGLTSEDVLGTYKAILKSSKIISSSRKLYFYRQNVDGITGTFSEKDFDLEKIWDLVIEYTKSNAPQYLEYAILNRKRINFTLLYRMMKNYDYNTFKNNSKAQSLLKELKKDKNILTQSKIDWKRKKIISIICKNDKIAYKMINIKTQVEKFFSKNIYWMYSIILMIFLEPPMFKEESFVGVEKVDLIYKILKLMAALFIIFVFYLKRNTILKCKKYKKYIFSTIIFELILMMSTLVNKGSFSRYIGPGITVIVMMMMPFLLVNFKLKDRVLKIVNRYFLIGYLINLITIILIDFLGKNHYIKNYFWGIDNRFIFMIIPWLYLEAMMSINRYNKLSLRFWIVSISCIGVLLLKYSTSALFGSLLILLIPLISNVNIINRVTSSKILCLFYIVINFVLTGTKCIQTIFGKVIDAVGKDITYSGRTYLWDGVYKVINSNPFLGIGTQSIDFDKAFFFNSTSPYFIESCRVIHAHNFIMTILYRGGILAFLMYGIIIFMVSYNNDMQKRNNKLIYSINFIFLTMIFILSLFDTMDFSFLFFIFSTIIIFSCKSIKGEKRNDS